MKSGKCRNYVVGACVSLLLLGGPYVMATMTHFVFTLPIELATLVLPSPDEGATEPLGNQSEDLSEATIDSQVNEERDVSTTHESEISEVEGAAETETSQDLTVTDESEVDVDDSSL